MDKQKMYECGICYFQGIALGLRPYHGKCRFFSSGMPQMP